MPRPTWCSPKNSVPNAPCVSLSACQNQGQARALPATRVAAQPSNHRLPPGLFHSRQQRVNSTAAGSTTAMGPFTSHPTMKPTDASANQAQRRGPITPRANSQAKSPHVIAKASGISVRASRETQTNAAIPSKNPAANNPSAAWPLSQQARLRANNMPNPAHAAGKRTLHASGVICPAKWA